MPTNFQRVTSVGPLAEQLEMIVSRETEIVATVVSNRWVARTRLTAGILLLGEEAL